MTFRITTRFKSTVCPGVLLCLLLAMAVAAPVRAGTCTVPGTHATIQEAINDPGCTQIDLADQTYPESVLVPRTLTLAGAAASVLEGKVTVTGSGTLLTVSDLEVRNGCQPEALSASNGARIEGSGLSVVRSSALPCPPVMADIFADGFESGDTSAWSTTVP